MFLPNRIKRIQQQVICAMLSFVIMSNSAIHAWSYTFSETRQETPQDFNDFLEASADEERIQMLQALQDLPKLKDEYFGKLAGLPNLEYFTTDKNKATASKPYKPSTFNEVLPETVIDAMNKNIIERSAISPETVRKALVWRAYNKVTYYFRGDKEVDYHGIVQWAARKAGIEKNHTNNLPTFTLERRIAERYFEAIWDKLTTEQRIAVLGNIEKEAGKLITNKSSIASMSGVAALGALQVAVNLIGFPFYVAMSVLISTVAGWFGITLPFVVYTSASHYIAILSGPIGWAIEAVLVAASIYFLGSAEKETVSAFIMTVNMIKSRRWADGR